jgi:hypothetical protein
LAAPVTKRLWTDAERERLGEMRAAGASIRECAAALGRTESACSQKSVEWDMATPRCAKWKRHEIRALFRMMQERKPLDVISAEMRRSRFAVMKRATLVRHAAALHGVIVPRLPQMRQEHRTR